jgi:hypothetical protein
MRTALAQLRHDHANMRHLVDAARGADEKRWHSERERIERRRQAFQSTYSRAVMLMPPD